MAKAPSITARELQARTHTESCESHAQYTGTRDELIAAGIVLDGDFPGDPESGRHTTHTFTRDGRHITIRYSSRVKSPPTFWVYVVDLKKAEAADLAKIRRDPKLQSLLDEREAARVALYKLIDSGEDFGVIRREEPGFTEWTGTKSALIAAGVCSEQHFPTGRKRYACGHADDSDGKSWGTDALRAGYFAHRVGKNPRGQDDAMRETLHYTDPEEFTDSCERMFMTAARILVDAISGDSCGPDGLRYDAETVGNVAAALDHARQVLQSSTPVVPRAVVSRDKRVTAAKTDTPFRCFMEAALASPGNAKKGKRARGNCDAAGNA